MFWWCSVFRKLKGSVSPSWRMWTESKWFSGIPREGLWEDTTKGLGGGWGGLLNTKADGKEVKPNLEGVGVGEKLEDGEVRC